MVKHVILWTLKEELSAIEKENVKKGNFCENCVKTLLRVCFFSIKL